MTLEVNPIEVLAVEDLKKQVSLHFEREQESAEEKEVLAALSTRHITRRLTTIKFELDWNLIDSLCMLKAPLWLIAERHIKDEDLKHERSIKAVCKLIESRILDRYGLSFKEYRETKIDYNRLRLVQKQFEVAMSGNPAMLIWLGKQMLEQTDSQHIKVEAKKVDNETVYEFVRTEPPKVIGESSL